MQESKGPAAKVVLGLDGKPAESSAPKCGNCYFFHINMAEGQGRGFCFGEPPKMFMVAPPKQLGGGKVAYGMENMRPTVDRISPPCGWWKPREWDQEKACQQ